ARELKTPIHLAMSFDEEVGCLGVPLLIGDLKARGLAPLACIVGEPSKMGLIRAHKGKIGGHVTVTGHAAHSGVAHLGANAVEAAYRDEFDDPKYTTIQACMVHGGTAVNIVAAQCSFDFDIRYLPGEDPHDYVNECRDFVSRHVEPEMKAVNPDCGFRWEFVP